MLDKKVLLHTPCPVLHDYDPLEPTPSSIDVTFLNLPPVNCFNSYCRAELKKSRRCSKCLIAIYCNSTCQKQDWSFHRTTCCKPESVMSKPGSAVAIRRPTSTDVNRSYRVFSAITPFDGDCISGDQVIMSVTWSFPISLDLAKEDEPDLSAVFVKDQCVNVRLYHCTNNGYERSPTFVTVPVQHAILVSWSPLDQMVNSGWSFALIGEYVCLRPGVDADACEEMGKDSVRQIRTLVQSLFDS